MNVNFLEVTIIFPPTITEFPKNVSKKLFSPANLTCRAIGSPIPMILWYKDDILITNDNSDSSVLLFSELNINDRGFYHCQAKNTINQMIHSVNSSKVLLNITSNSNCVNYDYDIKQILFNMKLS